MGQATTGTFRPTPLGIAIVESKLVPAKPLLNDPDRTMQRRHEKSLDARCDADGDADSCAKKRKELAERAEAVTRRWSGALR